MTPYVLLRLSPDVNNTLTLWGGEDDNNEEISVLSPVHLLAMQGVHLSSNL